MKTIEKRLIAEGYEKKTYPWGVRYSREEDEACMRHIDVYKSGEVEEWHILLDPGAIAVTDGAYNSVEDWLNGKYAE